jgi:hypothetical protein
MSGALSPAYFMGVSLYYHATVDGTSNRNCPYYMLSDCYAAIGQKEDAAELARKSSCTPLFTFSSKYG